MCSASPGDDLVYKSLCGVFHLCALLWGIDLCVIGIDLMAWRAGREQRKEHECCSV